MAAHDHCDRARKRIKPVFQQMHLLKIKMVGRFVQQENVRLGDPCACQKRKSLPPPAELTHGQLTQFSRNVEIIEHNVGAPAFIVARIFIQSAEHDVIERHAQEISRNILADIADLHSTRSRDGTTCRLALPH